MYAVRPLLWAAGVGAVALTAAGLLWNRGSTRPEVVTAAPEQIAAEAPKILGFAAARASLSAELPARSFHLREDWHVLPPNKGALVLFVPQVASDRVVVVRDETGKLLDSVDAKSGRPLLRQYRLDPGTYELNLEGFAGVAVTIQSGRLATIQLSQSGVSVTHKRSQKWEPIVDDLKASGSDIGPQNISPAEKVLNFAAELPDRFHSFAVPGLP